VQSFSEALGEELSGTGVRVLALCPGPTRTEFQIESASDGILPEWSYASAMRVATQGLNAFERNQRVRISGPVNFLMAGIPRFLPRRTMARLMAGLTKGVDNARRKRQEVTRKPEGSGPSV
jgi:short-subunit dehydrogenase